MDSWISCFSSFFCFLLLFTIKGMCCKVFHMLVFFFFLILVTQIFAHPLHPAKIDGFYLCICIRCMYAVEPAFDLHLLTLNEPLLHTLHCSVLKY